LKGRIGLSPVLSVDVFEALIGAPGAVTCPFKLKGLTGLSPVLSVDVFEALIGAPGAVICPFKLKGRIGLSPIEEIPSILGDLRGAPGAFKVDVVPSLFSVLEASSSLGEFLFSRRTGA
jgi:hypothetical protein